MTPEQIDRVFGRDRLKMVTGEHVEVYREAAAAGERRRYTKRFLNTVDADFAQWTAREWRILARLIGHGIDCVPEVVQFDRGGQSGTQLVQTYDAGATVDQWATILPVARGGRVLRHVFEDCAHWWALAHHCLRALCAIHEVSVVHLDIKGDNVCIPVGPPGFDPHGTALSIYPRYADLALIDFAFALVSRESLTSALPIGWQTEYDYQSPRLLAALEAGRHGDLKATRELDWRCDMYSLAAMLKRYLPEEDAVFDARACGWSRSRASAARELILALREAHDREASRERPHESLMAMTAARLAEDDLAASLQAGFTLARDASVTPVAPAPITPLTRLAPSIRVLLSPRAVVVTAPPTVIRRRAQIAKRETPAPRARSMAVNVALAVATAIGIAAMAAPWLAERWPALGERAPQEQAPPPAQENVAQAPAANGEEQAAPPPPAPPPETNAPAPIGDVRPLARAAPQARPSKPAHAQPAAKSPPVALAKAPVSAAPTHAPPARVRFYEPPPARVAHAETAAPVASGPPKEAVAPSESQPVAAPEPAKPAAPAAPPSPAAPRTVTTTTTTTFDPRVLLSLFDNFGKRNEAPAPIEQRASPRQADRAAAAPPPAAETHALPAPPAPVAEPPAREAAPRALPPESVAPQPVDLAVRARRTIAESLPAAAARAESEVARIYAVAANAGHPAQDRSVMEAVSRNWPPAALLGATPAPGMARQLSDDARQAFMAKRDVAGALDLQLRAFGANPRDPEIAGNLAYLYLRTDPPQAETARRLALVAIAQSPAPLRGSRADDWTTLGIANALTGRDQDAASALYVAIALTRNLDRTCRGVFRAVEERGNRMVPAAQSMLARLRQQGRDYESQYCTWPARLNTARG